MARTINRQLGNVGNLGDIVKHAALVEIATMLARGAPGLPRHPVSFVETHAFQLHAPLPDTAKWNREVNPLSKKHAAYMRYAETERASIAGAGSYRCSSGLVLDALGARLGRAVLAESNAASRAELAAQLAAEKHARVALVDDAAAIDRDATIPTGGALLVHVDPFALTPDVWSTFATPLSRIIARSADAVMIVYRYSRGARTEWPASGISVVAETRGGPHEVCAYASPEVADAVRDVCSALGWSVTEAD